MQSTMKLLFTTSQALSRQQKQLIIWLMDLFLPPLALWIACALTFHHIWPAHQLSRLLPSFGWLALSGAVASLFLGLPQIKLKSYTAFGTVGLLRYSAFVGIAAAFGSILPAQHLPAVAILAFTMILFLASAAGRMTLLWLYDLALRHDQTPIRTLIYGAGRSGLQLAAALKSHESIKILGFLDDDTALYSQRLAGLRIYSPACIRRLQRQFKITRVIIAIPSLSGPKQIRLRKMLEASGFEVQVSPSFDALNAQSLDAANSLNLSPNHFLNRAPFNQSAEDHRPSYQGRSVMVTGAGGSVGSELCRQLLQNRPRLLLLYEISEYALYTIERELAPFAKAQGTTLIAVLGSVTDMRILRETLRNHHVDIVLHAAAYKHVPLVEANPIAGLINNVTGTRTLADACIASGVEHFLLISTDKAVRPTNVMGASKRLAELVIKDLAARHLTTRFSIVRFGNVLGSSGSVIPLFKEQIAKGGPITLTHEDVTRYFMTIEEAVRLVLTAGSFIDTARLGHADVCVLDMGNPIRIKDLAKQMIEASGYSLRDAHNPSGDIEVQITGLRPGEKLHEELLLGEGLLKTPHAKILRAAEEHDTPLHMSAFLQNLSRIAASGNQAAARELALSAIAIPAQRHPPLLAIAAQ